MLTLIIKKQQEELKRLINNKLVPREALSDAQPFLASNLIKVVTGPRRAGKSSFVFLLLQGKRVAYLNFDDDNLLGWLSEHGTLTIEDELKTIYGAFEYVFFDEIQTLPDWELLVSRLQRSGHNIVISGSNAKLLSSELATHLSGRYHEIIILPFSWAEFQVAAPQKSFNDYITDGGFPEVVLTNISPRSYLDTLVQAIILKDIVGRKKVRQVTQIKGLYEYLAANPTRLFSYETLTEVTGIGSKHTVQKFLEYLQEAWLLTELKRFSMKLKEQLKAQRKPYPIDNGLIDDSQLLMESVSRKLEVQVLVDIMRLGINARTQVYYYKTKNNKEVDFIIKRKHKVDVLIQVCYDMQNIKTQTRELSAISEASAELQCRSMCIVIFSPLNSDDTVINTDSGPVKVLNIANFKSWLGNMLGV